MKGFVRALGLLSLLLLMSCNKEVSLQKYYVDHQEDAEFMSADVSTNMLFSNLTFLPEETQQSLKAIRKANILAYPISGDNQERYQKEKKEVLSILENGNYHQLFRLKFGNGSFQLRYLGEPDKVQELVLLAYSDDKGFALARLLGKDMNPNTIWDLINSGDLQNIDLSAFENLIDDLD